MVISHPLADCTYTFIIVIENRLFTLSHRTQHVTGKQFSIGYSFLLIYIHFPQDLYVLDVE